MVDGLWERVHCVGTGGAGMLPLAMLLKAAGHAVTAEDDAISDAASLWLERSGIQQTPAAQLPLGETLTLVHSSAIHPEHSALRRADEGGWQTMRRGHCLALWTQSRKLVAVAGSHGKTTTCGMLIDMLATRDGQVSYVLGGLFNGAAPPARLEAGPWAVVEVDESDGTIEAFSPEISIVLNADHDHHSRYADMAAYVASFGRLVERTRMVSFVNASLRPALGAAAQRSAGKVIWIGSPDGVTHESSAGGSGLTNIKTRMGSKIAAFSINRVGNFNAYNAVCAYWAATRVVKEGAFALDSITFRAIKRRQHCLYLSPQARVIEDYAHHPAQIAALMACLRERLPKTHLVVIFQPHRYSRTLALRGELADSLRACERLCLTDVFPASEAPVSGGDSAHLLEACSERSIDCTLSSDEGALLDELEAVTDARGTAFLFLGAGRTDVLARTFASRLATADPLWGSAFEALGSVSPIDASLFRNESMATKTALGMGGAAELYFEPDSLEVMIAGLQACTRLGKPFRVLGSGSSFIVPDNGVPGLVARLNHPRWKRWRREGGDRIWVGAGMRTGELCSLACRLGLAGFEFLEGIPGSVGGALRMNAGATGGRIFDVCERIRYLNSRGDLTEASREDLHIGYCYCAELREAVAIEAQLMAPGLGIATSGVHSPIDFS